MGKPIDLTGRSFGLWTVVSRAESPPGYSHLQHWLCRCACGKEAVRRGSQMLYAERQGKVQSCQSCGTKQQVTHGKSKTPEYKVWAAMLDRCRNPNHHAFARYGGRGITVDSAWESYEQFIADMGQRPSADHSLDRIDNDGNYSPNNCHWTTQRTQNRNQSRNVLLTFRGVTQSVMDWAEATGLSHAAITQRIKNLGWSVEEALTTPAGKACNWRGTQHKDAAQYEFNGKRQSLTQWAIDLGVPRSKLATRLKRGWTVERALSE